MNATSLYVSTSRLVFQLESGDQSLNDLYRLVPYLRQALSCTVCDGLLIEPYTPQETPCQHHVCRLCIGGRKNLKPTCVWCRDYKKYEVNAQLRILLQCYKSLCEYIISTPIYSSMHSQTDGLSNGNGSGSTTTSLADLIEEGAQFQDNYKSNSGLLKSTYSMLPCVYTNNSATQTLQHNNSNNANQSHTAEAKDSAQSVSTNSAIKTVSNGSALYSVLYAGSGNKITIKRKTDPDDDPIRNSSGSSNSRTDGTGPIFSKPLAPPAIVSSSGTSVASSAASLLSQNFKKPSSARSKSLQQKRKGCRCGNATPTPGKLTCCGQRCPCYVESKSCIDCNCRGCRNPHRADGFKIRPHIPQLECIELLNPDGTSTKTKCIELPLSSFVPASVSALSSSSSSSNSISTTNTISTNSFNQQQSRLHHHHHHHHQTISTQQQQIQQSSLQQQQQQHHPPQQQQQEISLDEDSIVFNPNDIGDSDIQVVNVYTTHLPESYTLPAIFM